MIMKISVVAGFEGQPNDTADQRCHAIFEKYEGEFIGYGTFAGADTFRWGIEYKMSEDKVSECIKELKNIGVRVWHRPARSHHRKSGYSCH
jgi:hypothetical protein